MEPGASRLIFLALSVRAGRRFDLHGTRGSAWWPPLPGSGVIVSLGAARVLRRWETDCNPDFTAYVHVELFDKKSEDANITAHFQNAGLPILYFEHDGNTIRVDGRLFVEGNHILVVPVCPPPTVDGIPDIARNASYSTLCQSEKPVISIPLSEAKFNFGDKIEVVSAEDEIRFYEHVLFPRLLGSDTPGERGEVWQAANVGFTLTPDEVVVGGQVGRVNLLVADTAARTLETRRLYRKRTDGTDSTIFQLYQRAKANANRRPVFLEIYRLYLGNDEKEPEFVTEDFLNAPVLVLHDR
ncbi:hypothetical protein [Breoghania sp.]|uniref:hypothetical protein n=1 Tax=Breoghania sp. TaxID=2065378 RepID=UPI0026327D83|nr:hypothetical protein [Breoghania sp.]